MALLFYTEPALTYDLDVFCLLAEQKSGLVTLEPIYKWYRSRGFQEEREHIVVGGIPMQMIPAYNDLVVETVHQAELKVYRGISVRVARVEHLLALMLQTGRSKDLLRAAQVRDEIPLNEGNLMSILRRYNLETKWKSLP